MTSGVCMLCNSRYKGAGMGRHLKSCLPRSLAKKTEGEKDSAQTFFHIEVRGFYLPDYWLHLMVDGDATLGTLDQLLRDVWLECCQHLSVFSSGDGDLEMGRKLKDVLKPGMELLHEYDFGTTTELLIRVLGEYEGPVQRTEPVRILARNEAPEILCDVCGKAPAVQICPECKWSGAGWLCQTCAATHRCDEDMRLPVVNSPRTGVCGYSG
jgi:hypothetical protein